MEKKVKLPILQYNYDYVNDYQRDSWYPYPSIRENNVNEIVKKAKRI